VKDIIPSCGGILTVLLENGWAFTVRQNLVEKSGIAQGGTVKLLLMGSSKFFTFGGHVLAAA